MSDSFEYVQKKHRKLAHTSIGTLFSDLSRMYRFFLKVEMWDDPSAPCCRYDQRDRTLVQWAG